MPDTIRSINDFLHSSTGLFKDNTSGEISAQDLRDFVLSTYRPESVCGGRLTLESGVPVSATSQLAKSIVYYTPYRHNAIGLYDGTSWKQYAFSELSITLSGLTPWCVYDVFIYDNAGTLTLELLSWTAPASGSISGASNASPIIITTPSAHGLSVGQLVYITGVGGNTNANSAPEVPWRIIAVGSSTTFSLGNEDGTNRAGNAAYTSGGTWYRADQNTARATAVVYQDGVLVKSGAASRRLLGSILATSSSTTQDSVTIRGVSNALNQVPRTLSRYDGASHTVQNVDREWNTYGCRCYFVNSIATHAIPVMVSHYISGGSGYPIARCGLNGAVISTQLATTNSYQIAHGILDHAQPLIGFNYINIREAETINSSLIFIYGFIRAALHA